MSLNKQNLVVFDFDGTLYKGDSLIDICKHYLLSNPLRSLYFFYLIPCWILWKIKLLPTYKFKSLFIRFLQRDTPAEIEQKIIRFWDTNNDFNDSIIKELDKWKSKGMIIVVASASPEIFVIPACKKLGITQIIASRCLYDGTRFIIEENCRGPVKIKRILEGYPNSEIMAAYSDNLDDLELLKSAQKGYFIKNGEAFEV